MNPTDATPAPPETVGVPRSVLALFWTSLGALVVVGVVAFLAARPPSPYPAGSPDEMLDSMERMVARGEPGRLAELIEIAHPSDDTTDRERMRDLYARLGRVLDAAGSLADTASEAFESDIARLHRELEEEGSPSLLQSLAGAARAGGGQSLGSPFGSGPGTRDRTSRAVAAFLTDPYGALADGRDRITTVTIDDDTAAVLWDDRPALPPFGILIRRQPDDRWKLVPPTQLPVIDRFMPKTASEYEIWGSLLATLENVLIDLKKGIESGRIGTLEGLADKAVENAVVPMGMVAMAYSQAMKERGSTNGEPDDGP
ncbi:MAG: hypothetical protein DHS20C14_16240 [Phycisphaeraceae bacterium]|nr:MAG: hypothetical protein DHS20C14_16240 [Phycisphaeraceae bacterium]